MKRLLLPTLLLIFMFFASCKSKVKTVTKDEDGVSTTTTYAAESLKKLAEGSDEMNKKTEELKKLTPLSLDQLKKLLPEELNGIKRTSFNSQSAMGYAAAEGEYKKDDNTELTLMIYDCAGEAGSSLYSLTYFSALNFQQENEREYTKTIDFKGNKAIENYKKDSKESSLTYVANDRLLIVMTGKNIEPSALEEVARNLELKL